MLIINATPHDVVVIIGDEKRVFPKSDMLARVETRAKEFGKISGIPVSTQELGALQGLGMEKPGVYYVVSSLCLEAGKLENRGDLLAPTGIVRDERGMIVGCSGFISSSKPLSDEEKYDGEIGVEHVGAEFRTKGYDLIKLVNDDTDILLSMYHSFLDVKIDIIAEFGVGGISVKLEVVCHDEVRHHKYFKTYDVYNDIMAELDAWL